MTDFEEQKMIEDARAGDPKAKYEMSQWARQMSALEPEEERWNRLAAKCLVESAQAGYEPAKKMVQALIKGQDPMRAEPEAEEEEAPAEEPAEELAEEPAEEAEFIREPADEPAEERPVSAGKTGYPGESSFYDYEREEEPEAEADEEDYPDEPQNFGQKLLGGLQAAAATVAALVGGLAGKLAEKKARAAAEAEAEEEEEAPSVPSRGRHSSGGGLTQWVSDNWSMIRVVCIVVIVVMAILIVLLLTIPVEDPTPDPTPTTVPTPTMEPTPTPEPFPNAATRTEISTTPNLSYRPAETEFLPASQSYTVDSDDGMNMRSGPSTEYDVLDRLASELRITAYASHQSGDETWYLVNTGGEWGWVIKDYLK